MSERKRARLGEDRAADERVKASETRRSKKAADERAKASETRRSKKAADERARLKSTAAERDRAKQSIMLIGACPLKAGCGQTEGEAVQQSIFSNLKTHNLVNLPRAEKRRVHINCPHFMRCRKIQAKPYFGFALEKILRIGCNGRRSETAPEGI